MSGWNDLAIEVVRDLAEALIKKFLGDDAKLPENEKEVAAIMDAIAKTESMRLEEK